jgi:hypothetical protein
MQIEKFLQENKKIKKSIRTKYSNGTINKNIELSSDDETITVNIPTNTKILTKDKKNYTSIIYPPKRIQQTTAPEKNKNIFENIEIKTDESVHFVDQRDMTPKSIEIKVVVPDIFTDNTIEIFFSEDNGQSRAHHSTTQAKKENDQTTITFSTTHFTIFSF